MKLLIFAFACLVALDGLSAEAAGWDAPDGHEQVAIWPGAAPNLVPADGPEIVTTSTETAPGKSWTAVTNVTVPTMTLFTPKGNNTGVAVLVFPGGGFNVLAIDLEGTEICDWLNSQGITAVLLKYRVPASGPHFDAKTKRHFEVKVPTALQDAQRTLGLMRLHAAEWKIDPNKIGVIGFSAGGHLVAATSTLFNKRVYKPIDDADKESCRPDFAVALYPGHMLENTSGDFELNPKIPVTSNTPPTFMVQAEDDPVDEVQNSLVYFAALKNAHVAVEYHVYAQGGHGFGLRKRDLPIMGWPDLMITWLKTIGMLPK